MGDPQWESLYGLAFWMDLTAYKSIDIPASKLKLAQSMWKKYLADDGDKRQLLDLASF